MSVFARLFHVWLPGVDPSMDPELAMALRVSMEEERARQEAASKATADQEGAAAAAVDPAAATEAVAGGGEGKGAVEAAAGGLEESKGGDAGDAGGVEDRDAMQVIFCRGPSSIIQDGIPHPVVYMPFLCELVLLCT